MARTIIKKAISISNQYLLFSVIAPLVLLVLLTIVGLLNYTVIQQDIRKNLVAQSLVIADNLIEPLLYAEGFARVVSEKIIQSNDTSPKSIANILKNNTIPSQSNHDVFTWTLFDFVNPNDEVVASSIHGVLPKPLKLIHGRRSWLTQSRQNPDELLLSSPDIGITSGEWVIPAGLGVQSESNEFLGIVSLGISIRKIANRLTYKSDGYVNFIVFDKEGLVIIDSNNISSYLKPVILDKVTFIKPLIESSNTADIEYNGNKYNYLKKLPKYDFYIAVGQNKVATKQLFNEKVLPQIFQTCVMGIFTILILFFFKYRLVAPISSLSKAAEFLMQGRSDIALPRGGPIEIHILSKQLINLQRYIKRIQRIDKKLFKAKQEAERANKAKSDFLANMSHELRTPLNAIIGYSEIIKTEMFGKVGNEKYTEYANDIHQSGLHLLHLINDILDISKAEAGKFYIDGENIDVCEIARESLKLISEQASQKNIPINVQIQDKPLFIYADKLRIKQIIINILSNAVKFSDAGQAIIFTVKQENGVTISVQDHGIGIAKSDIPKILEKFGNIRNSMSRQSEGTGLGLWLTKMLIEAHNGVLEIESEVGVGTKVIAFFPDNILAKNPS